MEIGALDIDATAEPVARMERLGDEIAQLSAHLEAVTAHLLDLIRQLDTGGGWNHGFRSCAHWLAWRAGMDLGAARERVRVARALGSLPRLADALAHGELSYAKVRALTRVATAETEERLLAVGRAGTACQVERIVRGWRRVDTLAEAREATQRHRSRALHVYQDEDGMVVVRGRLAPEEGAVRALHHRDRGCRFPGCGVSSGQGHHIRHWAQGGPITLSNLATLCRAHHRAVHEEGYQMERRPDGELLFRRPDGRPLPEIPPSPAVPDDPVRTLRARNEAAGLHLHARTTCPGWLGERLDVGWALDVLHPRALQPAAMGE
jgi:hypothetical protein